MEALANIRVSGLGHKLCHQSTTLTIHHTLIVGDTCGA